MLLYALGIPNFSVLSHTYACADGLATVVRGQVHSYASLCLLYHKLPLLSALHSTAEDRIMCLRQ